MQVRPKKSLGQHFLKDENIADKIVGSLSGQNSTVIEIGPGTGVLSKYLIEDQRLKSFFIETDQASVDYLNKTYPEAAGQIIHADFLTFDLGTFDTNELAIIGNLPYNITAPIFFRIIHYRQIINEFICMIQKEVAERISSPPGSRKYGILSVLLQAYFDIEYLFTVNEHVFYPPPKVKSGVIRLKRNNTKELACDEKLFVQVVKRSFNQRRKMLRNSLKPYSFKPGEALEKLLHQRPEQLCVDEFVTITQHVIG